MKDALYRREFNGLNGYFMTESFVAVSLLYLVPSMASWPYLLTFISYKLGQFSEVQTFILIVDHFRYASC